MAPLTACDGLTVGFTCQPEAIGSLSFLLLVTETDVKEEGWGLDTIQQRRSVAGLLMRESNSPGPLHSIYSKYLLLLASQLFPPSTHCPSQVTHAFALASRIPFRPSRRLSRTGGGGGGKLLPDDLT